MIESCLSVEDAEVIVPKKVKKSKKRAISTREFQSEYAKIVANHLSALSPEEQDKRLHAAYRRASRSRGASSTARGSGETREIPLSARARE